MKINGNFLGGRGEATTQKTFRGGSMDIFWNCTIRLIYFRPQYRYVCKIIYQYYGLKYIRQDWDLQALGIPPSPQTQNTNDNKFSPGSPTPQNEYILLTGSPLSLHIMQALQSMHCHALASDVILCTSSGE